MMYIKLNKLITYFIISIALFACNNSITLEKTKANDSTAIFNNYLLQQHNYNLSYDTTLFVVIPKHMGCDGCKNKLKNYCNDNGIRKNVRIICSDEFMLNSNFISQKNILVDSNCNFEKLNIGTQDISLITVCTGKLKSIEHINANNIENTISLLK